MQAMLKRLKVRRFRAVAPNVELVFDDRFNVLLGRNGTGKTTLLDLVAAIVGSRLEAYRNEHFSIAYELRFDTVNLSVELECRAGQGRPPTWSFEIEVRNDAELCRFVGTQNGTRMTRDGVDTELQAIVPFESYFPTFALEYASRSDPASPADTSTHEGLGALYRHLNCIRFDEGLDAFFRMTGSGSVWMVLTDIGGTMNLFSPGYCPASLLRALRSRASQLSTTGRLLTHEELPFLKTAVDLMGFEGGSLQGRLINKEATQDGLRWSFGNPEYSFTTDSRGSLINHNYLSYGQKRLLAFLYYLEANDDIVVADELVNGMHHEWIEASIEAIGPRQAFLTSQNPFLLDALPIETLEHAERSLIQCTTEDFDDRTSMVWRNLSHEDAGSFFRAYEVGIQHVGDILRTKGLW